VFDISLKDASNHRWNAVIAPEGLRGKTMRHLC
jgi:hypothetical protein